MKKKVFQVFLKGFLQSIFVIVCMLVCCVGGYFGSRCYFMNKNESGSKTKAEDIIDDAQLDAISKNLIFVWDEDKGRITGCVLEVFDTEQNKLDYITIPTSGQITISSDMYKKIVLINSEIPQVFKLSKLCSYFDEGDDRAYGYGVLILEEYFNIDISYYTVVNAEQFDEMFDSKEHEIDNTGDIDSESYRYSKSTEEEEDEDAGSNPYEHDDRFVSDSYADLTTQANSSGTTSMTTTTEEAEDTVTTVKVRMLKKGSFEQTSGMSENELSDYVREQCDLAKSNLDIDNKLSYVAGYMKLTEEDVRYHCIPGRYSNNVYQFHTQNATKLFKNCNVNEKPKEKDTSSEKEKEKDVEPVEDVVILNSTGTSGVAAGWSQTLTGKGFHVLEVGNYSTNLTDTKIVVAKKGQGEELLSYFSNAKIEVGEVPEGADAQIIIGQSDVNH